MLDHSKELLLRYEQSLDCIHCGLCLSACPTYEQTGNEALSPRGRISLMRALAEGELSFEDGVENPIVTCLQCRACESTCPSAVQFGSMMEITRHELHRAKKPSLGQRIFSHFLLKKALPSRRWMAFLSFSTRCYRSLGLSRLLRFTGAIRLLPKTLQRMESALPQMPPSHARRPLPLVSKPESGRAKGRVAFLRGCVMPELFGDINRQCVDALVAQGFEVVVPEAQTCCGALHIHGGDQDFAKNLARQNIAAFNEANADWIIVNSAGCGAAMAEYGLWFKGEEESKEAQAMSAQVIDILEFFDRQDLTPRGKKAEEETSIAYDAPCHLHHAQGCQNGPQRVIAKIPHIPLVPLEGFDSCCGAAGIYNLTQAEMSDKILASKLDQLEKSGAKVLLTGNPGCLMQWEKGIKSRGLDVVVRHPAYYL